MLSFVSPPLAFGLVGKLLAACPPNDRERQRERERERLREVVSENGEKECSYVSN